MLYRNISIGKGEDTKNIYFYMHKNVLSVITKDIYLDRHRDNCCYTTPLSNFLQGADQVYFIMNSLYLLQIFKSPSHNVNRFICSDKLKYRQRSISINQGFLMMHSWVNVSGFFFYKSNDWIAFNVYVTVIEIKSNSIWVIFRKVTRSSSII